MPADEFDSERDASPRLRRLSPRSLVPLLPALGGGLLVYVAYLLTHPYPALGGGLFLAMAEAVAENGYALPLRIAGYTPGGIPFAYPPLAFYLLAPLLDRGASPLALARVLPGALVLCTLVPTALLGRELLGSDAQAGFAAFVVATSPAVLAWHLSAGGVVRTLAFFFTVCGLYTGHRLFHGDGCDDASADDGDASAYRRWAIPTAILFGSVVLTHPLYPVLFGSSVLYFYLARDRSFRGLLVGALVALGGVVLAAPWWFTVIARHGVEAFVRTAGSRLGIGQGLVWFPTTFAYLPATRFLALWHVLVLLGALFLLARRRYFLVGWFAVTALVYPEPRFLLFVGAFLASAFVFEGFLPLLTAPVTTGGSSAGTGDPDSRSPNDALYSPRFARHVQSNWLPSRDRVVALSVLCVFVVYGTATGALYAANYEPIPERPLDRLLAEPLPSYVDRADVRAMGWVRANTPRGATFLVAGDAAEWFPLLAERTSLASPWGAEWLPPAERTEQIARYRATAECSTVSCLMRVFDRVRRSTTSGAPTYLYVPREGSRSWTARDEFSTSQWRELVGAFERSRRYEIVYRNRGVVILRPRDRPARSLPALRPPVLTRSPVSRPST